MSAPDATVTVPWVLHATANAESARVNTSPPCAIAWPFTMDDVTAIRSRARPGPTSTSSMPSPALAASCAHIASAPRRAACSSPSAPSELTEQPPRALGPLEQRAQPVPPRGEHLVQPLEDERCVDAGPLAPLQRPRGVTGAEDHRDVDVLGGGLTASHEVDGLVDQHRHGPRHDAAG